jgi:ABC-2 type transport system permease protein
VRRFFSLLWQGISLGFATRLANRFDFVSSLLVMLGIELLPSLVTVLIYGNGLSFPGWSVREAVLIQAVFLMAKGVAYPFLGGMVWNTSEMVREGTFELLLLKPRHPLLLAMVQAFDAEDLGKLCGGLGLFTWCLSGLPGPSAAQASLFGLLFVGSLILFGACLVTMASVLLVWVGNARIHEVFETLSALGQYPPLILPRRLRGLATAPLPLLGFAVLPASALLGRIEDAWQWATLSALVLLLLSLLLWNRMLRRLASAGG